MPGRPGNDKKEEIVSPGPAAYEVKNKIIEEKKKVYSFSKEPKSKEEKQKLIPGPGQYDNSDDQKMKRSPSWG